MGLTPHIYTTSILLNEEIFPLSKEKNIPVKNESELSSATKPDLKVSLKMASMAA